VLSQLCYISLVDSTPLAIDFTVELLVTVAILAVLHDVRTVAARTAIRYCLLDHVARLSVSDYPPPKLSMTH
jgi:hypothetical protein